MNDLAKISYEPPYRQLDQAARQMVDDLIRKIERQSDITGAPLFDILASYQPTEREITFLARGLVRAAIFDRVRDLTDAQNVTPRRIIKELEALAFSSIDHFRKPGASLDYGTGVSELLIAADGGLFELEYATPEQRAAVKEVEIEENARTGKIKTKIKLHDKLAALRMLGQIRGLFNADGDPINPEKWVEGGGIPVDSSQETAAEIYMQAFSDDS